MLDRSRSEPIVVGMIRKRALKVSEGNELFIHVAETLGSFLISIMNENKSNKFDRVRTLPL